MPPRLRAGARRRVCYCCCCPPSVGSFGELGMYDNAFWLEEEEQAAGGAAGGRDGGHGDGGGGGVGGGGGGGIARSAPIAAPGFAAAGAHAAGR